MVIAEESRRKSAAAAAALVQQTPISSSPIVVTSSTPGGNHTEKIPLHETMINVYWQSLMSRYAALCLLPQEKQQNATALLLDGVGPFVRKIESLFTIARG